jgi:crossover junction endodeoxyribonuclease RusA
MSLTVPWPPSVNNYWKPTCFCGRPGITLTPKARDYRQSVVCAIRDAMGPPLSPIEGPVRIDVELRPPDRRKRDIDNHLKSLFDALTYGSVWKDDSQVDEMTVRRGPVISGGHATVIISELLPPDLP